MTEDEIKEAEAKVQKLSTFLKEDAIQTLVKNLQRNEGVPTDSASLTEFFHQNGVNMRYLGYIAEEIKDKNLTQMKYMVEREVVLRSLKHLLNKYIRECKSDELLSELVSHLLNCLLAPKDFLKKMDDGLINKVINTVRTAADMNMINVGLDPDLNPDSIAISGKAEVEK